MTIKRYFVSMTWMNSADHVAVEQDKDFFESGRELFEGALISEKTDIETYGLNITVYAFLNPYSLVLSRYFIVEGDNDRIDTWARCNNFVVTPKDEENRP